MVPRQTITNMYDTEQLWAPIHEIFGLMKMLPRMLRFTDGRNPELQARVLPDGSNIPLQEPALITVRTLYIAFCINEFRQKRNLEVSGLRALVEYYIDTA